jgi:putative ABC transport system substrate-binding protein
MKRRTLLGSAAATIAARAFPAVAQPANVPVIGFMNVRSAAETQGSVAGFIKGLRDNGFIEGQNVRVEFRWADGAYNRLPEFAAELVRARVAVIAAGGGPAGAVAAKAATSTIPIVFLGGTDPVRDGLVSSLSRPGGNVTGVLNVATQLTAKRLSYLREFVPSAQLIAMLYNPNYLEAETQLREARDAASQMQLKLIVAPARTESEIAQSLAELAQQKPDALLVANDPYFASQRFKLIPLVERMRIPAAFAQREYAEAGGLMTYGTNFADLYEQAGVYVGRILKGEKPADLPVTQPTRYELVINRKTANAMRIELPTKVLALADDVLD